MTCVWNVSGAEKCGKGLFNSLLLVEHLKNGFVKRLTFKCILEPVSSSTGIKYLFIENISVFFFLLCLYSLSDSFSSL